MALVSTPSRRKRSMFSHPKSSSPTQPMIPAGRPSRPTWSMKMAGAPLGKGPTRVPGSRKLWPRSVAMISTRISPMVMIRAIRRLLSGATLGLHVHRDRAQNNAVPGLTPSIESDMVRANGREAAAFLLFSVFGFYFDLRYGGVLPYVVVLQIALYVGLNASLWTIVL